MKIPTTPPSVKVTLPDLPRTQAAADRLRAVFRGSLQEVLLGVAAAGLGLLAGCEPDPFAKYEKRECGSRDWAVNAPVGVNSLTLRSPRELRTVLGKPCLGAQDMAGCLGNFEQATKCEETIFGCEPLVVGTRGDAVFAIKDPAALIELMKPIDTVDEAALVVTFNRYRVDCTALGAEVVRGTDEDSGFEVLAGLSAGRLRNKLLYFERYARRPGHQSSFKYPCPKRTLLCRARAGRFMR